jgi:hypothetical protein
LANEKYRDEKYRGVVWTADKKGLEDKKTPPGGERSRGGANKGTGIL